MELLIAIFGLLFYGIAVAGGKAQAKERSIESSERIAWHNARRKAWESKVYSVTAVHEVNEYLDDNKSLWVRTLAKAYMQLPSCSGMTENQVMDIIYKNCARDSKTKFMYHNDYEMCILWLLAQRGKIRSIGEGRITTEPAYTDREKMAWDMQYEFAMLILREIRKVAPESRLIFTTPSGALDFQATVYDAERDVERFRYKGGAIRWLHQTYFDSDLKYR